MCAAGYDESARLGAGPRRRAWSATVATAIVGLSVASVLWAAALPPSPLSKIVRFAPEDVILAVADIPDIGWGLRASGSTGTGVWRLFSVHNELILAFLNVTLWVEADSTAAARAFFRVGGSVNYSTRDGMVEGADASLFWNAGSSPCAGMIVRRYNVVFVLSAYLESSWDLTRSDLGGWSGWQLTRIEAAAD